MCGGRGWGGGGRQMNNAVNSVFSGVCLEAAGAKRCERNSDVPETSHLTEVSVSGNDTEHWRCRTVRTVQTDSANQSLCATMPLLTPVSSYVHNVAIMRADICTHNVSFSSIYSSLNGNVILCVHKPACFSYLDI